MKIPRCDRLRLVLGDQLSPSHVWYSETDADTLYLVAELRQEATYTRHHVQKVVAFFAAMESFAGDLREAGHRVLHLGLDDTAGFADLPALLAHVIERSGARCFEYQRPDEYRLKTQLDRFAENPGIETSCCDTGHFLLPYDELRDWFPPGKQHRMEHFYRRMRRRLGILVDRDGKPEGGRWNFDKENRQTLPAERPLPPRLEFKNPVGRILDRLQHHEIPTIGRIEGHYSPWPLNRRQSLQLLGHFTGQCLPDFGSYQDAMTGRDWSLFHSRLSFSLNTKMLSPDEVVEAVVAAWRADPDRIPLSAAEGFVRQIIGWREFMRGIYWTRMPEYAGVNHFGHDRPLPGFYWDGRTRMACMAQAIGQSLDHAYAHHIQRLMVTGNFALLAGLDPFELDEWYLGIYIDAIEWVELPNTRGMSQFADGGVVASKPYCASGSYINRMSDHCSGCAYDVNSRSGDASCPFNSLYWHFMHRNRETLAANPRMGMLYRNWDRMGEARRAAVLQRAAHCLANIGNM